MTAQHRLIVALDFATTDKAQQMIELLDDRICFYKVGLELFLNSQGSILEFLRSRNKRIFLDLKFHDIPNTAAMACRFAAGLDAVNMFNIHASGGSEMIKQCVSEKRPDQILLAVTALTSLDDNDIQSHFHTRLSVPEFALSLAKTAKESGADGVVCSPQEASSVKEHCGNNFITVCPGIRLHNSRSEDQKRILGPKEAIQNGADYLVVGRPIISAENPQQVAEFFIQEIEKGSQ